jgi:hypothetical protein
MLESSNAVQQNKQTTALILGTNITVALDQNAPKRAFIRELYT